MVGRLLPIVSGLRETVTDSNGGSCSNLGGNIRVAFSDLVAALSGLKVRICNRDKRAFSPGLRGTIVRVRSSGCGSNRVISICRGNCGTNRGIVHPTVIHSTGWVGGCLARSVVL